MTTPYDPIPASVRAAWGALRAACEVEGLRFHGLLHADPGYLAAGEDREVGDDLVLTRYWPSVAGVLDGPCIAARVSP